ncbi:MAG: hypothetical protein IJH05_05870 [Firmicutes bacterium]|nr:hypothetical protein [Bacillota bacterium]
MRHPFWTLGNAVLGGLAGYLMCEGRKTEGIIIFAAIVVLNVSKALE